MRNPIKGLPSGTDERLVADVIRTCQTVRAIRIALWREAVMRATAIAVVGEVVS